MIVVETGVGLCTKCGDRQRYRYQLIDTTNAGRVRVDRLWLCPLRHYEHDVDHRGRKVS
jgi:hypothetical protein